MATEPNRRYELRAYEESDPVRVAALIGDDPVITRFELKDRWAARYPQHVPHTGKHTIAKRVSRGLSLLRVAGIVAPGFDPIAVADPERLGMAARNASIVLDTEGNALPPGQWDPRPEAPEHLRGIQDDLMADKAAGVAGVWDTTPHRPTEWPAGGRPVLDDVAPPVGHYAGEVWRLASGLAELGIELEPGPIDQAPVSTALNRLEVFRGEDTGRGRPPSMVCPGRNVDDAEAELQARLARTLLAEMPQVQLVGIAREMAKGVINITYTLGVPHTFWHSDTRIRTACWVLGLDPDRARETGLADLPRGHDW